MYNDPSGHFAGIIGEFVGGIWKNKMRIAIMGTVNGIINSIVNHVFGGEDKDSVLLAFFKGFAVGAGCAAVYYGVAAIKVLSVIMNVIEVLSVVQEVIEFASNVVLAIVYGVTGNYTQMAIYVGFAVLCFVDILAELGLSGKVGAEGPKGAVEFGVRHRVGNPVAPTTKTYEMALNPELYVGEIVSKYGINMKGSGQKIDIVFNPDLVAAGKTRMDNPNVIELGLSAFISEEELANTIAHELNHARSFLKGGNAPEEGITGAYHAGDTLAAYIRGEL